MNIDNLVSMFTQKSGIQQSLASTIVSVVIKYVMQQIVGTSSKGGLGNIMSLLTNLEGNLNPEHPLVRQVQEKTGLQDQQQVTQYTEQAVSVIKQEATKNPQGIESLFGNVLGGIGGGMSGDTGEQVKKGLGGLIKGFFGSKDK
ncbi:MAG: hypothetical protein WCE93_12790 [Nitrososphaeraceae archaeon]